MISDNRSVEGPLHYHPGPVGNAEKLITEEAVSDIPGQF
jgi:hypothetical protein